MKKMILIIMLFCIFNVRINVNADDNKLINGAQSGILIETKTKSILYEKNKDTKLSPASMTKIMTLLLVYEAMENNLFDKNTILTTSDYASSMGGSQVYLKVGEQITVDEAIKCVCIASANDCAVLLAEKVSGSESQFVNKMNQRAKELGCNNTNFNDCTGLSEDNHLTTSYDMSMMALELVNRFPDVLNYTNLKEDYIRKNTESPFWLVNTNKLVGRVEGLNGLKTGYTSFSGYCITLHMTEGNMSLISVVMGYDNALKRNSESLELLRYGFNTYKLDKIFSSQDIIESIEHILYDSKISIFVKNDIFKLCNRNEKNNYENKYEYQLDNNLINGKIDVYLNDEIIGSSTLVCDKLNRKSFFKLLFDLIKKAI